MVKYVVKLLESLMLLKWFFLVLLDLTCACFCNKVGYAPILVLNNLAEFIATRFNSKLNLYNTHQKKKKKFNMVTYFENIIVRLLLFLFLKHCQIKFYVNRMLFII